MFISLVPRRKKFLSHIAIPGYGQVVPLNAVNWARDHFLKKDMENWWLIDPWQGLHMLVPCNISVDFSATIIQSACIVPRIQETILFKGAWLHHDIKYKKIKINKNQVCRHIHSKRYVSTLRDQAYLLTCHIYVNIASGLSKSGLVHPLKLDCRWFPPVVSMPPNRKPKEWILMKQNRAVSLDCISVKWNLHHCLLGEYE